jgi:hypothetical protein
VQAVVLDEQAGAGSSGATANMTVESRPAMF